LGDDQTAKTLQKLENVFKWEVRFFGIVPFAVLLFFIEQVAGQLALGLWCIGAMMVDLVFSVTISVFCCVCPLIIGLPLKELLTPFCLVL
jgi:hypothetical protein